MGVAGLERPAQSAVCRSTLALGVTHRNHSPIGPPRCSPSETTRVADIFISYTSQDRPWADWIGLELKALGHVPHIDHWEVSAGGNIMEWMEKRHHEANHVLCIVSETYLKKPYSSLERQAGQWATVTARPNFVFLSSSSAEKCRPCSPRSSAAISP